MDQKQKLVSKSNDAYYHSDEPILTDTEFNLLAEDGLDIELSDLPKVKHQRISYSLKKLKTFSMLRDWIRADIYHGYLCPKYDGNSIRVKYVDGILITAATRGDGYYGVDLTHNVKHSNCPKQLPMPLTAEITYEAILPKTADLGDTKSNRRNIVAGLLNATKEIEYNLLAQVQFVALAVDTPQGTNWSADLEVLKQLQETVELPEVISISAEVLKSDNTYDVFEKHFENWTESLNYDIDGVVLHLCLPENHQRNDNTLLIPKNSAAVKFSDEEFDAVVDQIIWKQGLHRKIYPKVFLKEPVFIDGANIRRATASNYALAQVLGLGPDAKIGVIKSGGIIPEISSVFEKSPEPLELPECPDCGECSSLDENEVHAICTNPECPGIKSVKFLKQLDRLDIQNLSGATGLRLVEADILTLGQVLEMTQEDFEKLPKVGPKKASQLVADLSQKRLSEAQVINLCCIPNIALKRSQLIINTFGSLENLIEHLASDDSLPKIPGLVSIAENLEIYKHEILEMFNLFKAQTVKNTVQQTDFKICVTDTYPEMTRKKFGELLRSYHIELLSSVNSECQLLVCQNLEPEKFSNKFRAALRSGIPIVTYDRFVNTLYEGTLQELLTVN